MIIVVILAVAIPVLSQDISEVNKPVNIIRVDTSTVAIEITQYLDYNTVRIINGPRSRNLNIPEKARLIALRYEGAIREILQSNPTLIEPGKMSFPPVGNGLFGVSYVLSYSSDQTMSKFITQDYHELRGHGPEIITNTEFEKIAIRRVKYWFERANVLVPAKTGDRYVSCTIETDPNFINNVANWIRDKMMEEYRVYLNRVIPKALATIHDANKVARQIDRCISAQLELFGSVDANLSKALSNYILRSDNPDKIVAGKVAEEFLNNKFVQQVYTTLTNFNPCE